MRVKNSLVIVWNNVFSTKANIVFFYFNLDLQRTYVVVRLVIFDLREICENWNKNYFRFDIMDEDISETNDGVYLLELQFLHLFSSIFAVVCCI